jgi:cyclopropane fatty-acyl-phospholipid synthase-like methyltransferase
MMNNEITLQTWNKLAQQYQDKFMEMDLYNATYDQFCEVIANEKATILELGCGPGNITKYLIAKNPNYTILATDTAPSMIALGKNNVPEAQFQLLDSRNILELNRTFDGIISGFVLPYLTKEEAIEFIKNSSQLLHKNGVLYFSCIEDDYSKSEIQTSSDGQFKMQVYYHQEDYLLKTIAENGFKIQAISRINYEKSESETAVHLVIIGRKINLV